MSDTQSPDIVSPAPHETYRVRYPLRIRRLTVTRVVELTRSMIRVTLSGPDLAEFASRGHDDHVKLFFARPGEETPSLPTFGPNGPVFPEGAERPIARDYTPRRYDAAAGELDLDFAVHEAGPATAWAMQAEVGSTLHVAGPRGSMIVPDDFDWYLLVGDETALPAIARRLEELRPEAKVRVLIEVGGAEDELPLASRASSEITWLHRGAAAPGEGRLLDDAVAALELPKGEGFAWVACESDTAKRLRRILVEDHGVPKQRVKASGYWKRGLVSYHDTHDE
ncbi:siderophore-interacting protein [Kaistia sp. 32K]|uniref:siderophore-interacting protein n=1 Tax=Kaistia sp. 32K TaxID=2795690 RepID=UPI001915440B|nr:siderophore-interacting protein [Kaistia sp. 32K]BCP54421.1 siderophore-interacting protein [Kaistia sp. 32K]